VKTASGATAVQVVWSCQRGSRKIEYIGSARAYDALGFPQVTSHDEADPAVDIAAAHQSRHAD
jgi:hypothetical protein